MKKGEKKQSNVFKITLLLLVIVTLSLCINGVSAATTASTASSTNTVNTPDNSHIYVNTNGNDNWDGLSATYNTSNGSEPKATINNATRTVKINGIVQIAVGSYKEHGITINQAMTIIGDSQDYTIVDGTRSGSIFDIVSGSEVTIKNLKLTNGYAYDGGAIVNHGVLTVTNCTFSNNVANDGFGDASMIGAIILLMYSIAHSQATTHLKKVVLFIV